MSTLNNMPGGAATSLTGTDKIYVVQGVADRSATIAQVGAAVGAGVTTVAGRSGAVTLSTTDISGFTAAASAAAPVASVAGRTGGITLGTSDITGFTAAATAAAPVQSVAGRTGTITLGTSDITGFTAAATAAAPVQSVAGRTGTVTLGTSDISGFVTAAANAAPVQSVAGRTGAIVLTTADLTNFATVSSTITASTKTSSYTLVLADAGTMIEMNVASANTLTVPPNSSVAFPIGSLVRVTQMGAGVTTIAPGAGVTLRSSRTLALRAQWSNVKLRKRATDEWVISGDTT